MSKLFDKLKAIQEKSAKTTSREFKELPAFVVLAVVVLLIQVMTLDQLKAKDRVLSSMDSTISQQQEQMSAINKKFDILKTSNIGTNLQMQARIHGINSDINNTINTTINHRFDDFDRRMEDKVQALAAVAEKNSDNVIRREAVLKNNMDQMGTRLIKLQNMVNQVYQIAEVENNTTPVLNGE